MVDYVQRATRCAPTRQTRWHGTRPTQSCRTLAEDNEMMRQELFEVTKASQQDG